MKTIAVRNPATLESLELQNRPDPSDPGPGEIRVRLHASSLNFHDLSVVTGIIPTEDNRIPMSDGAGWWMPWGQRSPGSNRAIRWFPLSSPTGYRDPLYR